jgi:thiol-disulfide isomerase/thioredoxin
MQKTLLCASRTAAFLIALFLSSLAVPAGPPQAAAASGRQAASPPPTPVDAAALRKKLVALRGRIVVLNLWATWCKPCVMEFPELVRFERAYRSRGVTVIGLSMDDPRNGTAPVARFLQQQKAAFPVYTMKLVDPQTVVHVFDKYWEGAIPMTYVFDRTGYLQTRLQSARTLYEFESAVKPLLKK